MADSNTQYQGFVESVDIAQYKRNLYPLSIIGRTSTDEEVDNYLAHNPDVQALVDKLVKTVQDSLATVDAVKVAYTGTTQAERIVWINERLQAIANRIAFIKTTGDRYNSILVNTGQASAGDVFLSVWQLAFSVAIPAIGTVIGSLVSSLIKQDKAATINDAIAKLQAYTQDLQQLVTIQAVLKKELAGYDPTSYAATPWPTWYYFAGAGLLLLLFLWIRAKRRKR